MGYFIYYSVCFCLAWLVSFDCNVSPQCSWVREIFPNMEKCMSLTTSDSNPQLSLPFVRDLMPSDPIFEVILKFPPAFGLAAPIATSLVGGGPATIIWGWVELSKHPCFPEPISQLGLDIYHHATPCSISCRNMLKISHIRWCLLLVLPPYDTQKTRPLILD